MGFAKSLRKLRWKLVRGGPGRRERTLTVSTKNGLLSFSNMDLVIGKGLYIARAFEFDLITRVMDYLRREGLLTHGDCMIDVGANVGMICIAMLKHGYFRRALAFEPGARNFQLLQHNIAQNGLLASIQAYPRALSDRAGEMQLELSENNFGDHRLRAAARVYPGLLGEELRRTEPVRVCTLDDVLAGEVPFARERIGLIWVDIQGHEAQFLAGAQRTLAEDMPVVSEFWPYGISRAGFDRASFTEVAASLFSEFVHVRDQGLEFARCDIGELRRLFDAFPGPDDHQQIIFLGRAK